MFERRLREYARKKYNFHVKTQPSSRHGSSRLSSKELVPLEIVRHSFRTNVCSYQPSFFRQNVSLVAIYRRKALCINFWNNSTQTVNYKNRKVKTQDFFRSSLSIGPQLEQEYEKIFRNSEISAIFIRVKLKFRTFQVIRSSRLIFYRNVEIFTKVDGSSMQTYIELTKISRNTLVQSSRRISCSISSEKQHMPLLTLLVVQRDLHLVMKTKCFRKIRLEILYRRS